MYTARSTIRYDSILTTLKPKLINGRVEEVAHKELPFDQTFAECSFLVLQIKDIQIKGFWIRQQSELKINKKKNNFFLPV